MRQHWIFLAIAAAVVAAPATSRAQGFGFRGPGGGMSRMALLRIEAVHKELELIDDQIEDIDKLEAALREGNQRGRGGQGRPNFNELSEQEREKMIAEFRKQAEERAKKEREGLAKILLPPQQERLNEIFVQVQGVGALGDPEVAKALKITDAQTEKLGEVRNSAMQGMREKMRELFQSGDRDKIREVMADFQKDVEKKTLAVLTSAQRKEFDELKGEPFELPEDALRSQFGGRGRGRGAQGDRGDRERRRPGN